jgi:mannitol/fructose-specific phosphotransferase system IIA component (Ntr-type)
MGTMEAEFLPEEVSLSCPVCGTALQVELHTMVDVGLRPELKGQVLRGRLNTVVCSCCGSEGFVAAPLLYHDPEKEVLVFFAPPEAEMSDQEQQQLLGKLTNQIMARLAPEQRKGYLLIPKVVLTFQGLVEAILQAEGVTPEIMAAHRALVELLNRLLDVQEDEERLRQLVREADEQIGFEFFAALGAYIEALYQDGRPDEAFPLQTLRERLLELSSYGRKLAARMVFGSPEHPPLGREELLERAQAASSEEELAELVTWYRSGVDYLFFQMLSERIERARREDREEEAERLEALRGRLLALTERLDEQSRQELENAAGLLRRLLAAPEPESFVRAHLQEFNEAFFIVLGANLQAADEAGDERARERLRQIGTLVLEIAQEKLPPAVRLIRRLLVAPDEATVDTLLAENRPLVTDEWIALMRDLAREAQEEKTADRLRALADRAAAWLRQA